MRLFDSDVAIDYLRGVEAALDLVRTLVEQREAIGASEIVRFELLAGARQQELAVIERFFSALVWFPVDESVARTAGLLANRFAPAFSGSPPADYLIAATVVNEEALLLTKNIRHFPMFSNLLPAY